MAALRRAEARRRRLLVASGAVAAVLVVVALMVVAAVLRPETSGEPSRPASAQVAQAVTSVPASAFDQVGRGQLDTLPKRLTGEPPLSKDGKPLVLYVGADYCPFCAAQRWGLAVALARFGTFTDLKTTTSAADDIYPNTATLSFHGATYSSPYLAFEGVELATNKRSGRSYEPLDSLTPEQESIVRKYNAPPYVQSAGGIPFVDFANEYLMAGAAFSPGVLEGMTAEEIAKVLSDPNSEVGKSVLGLANAFTTVLCQLTDGKPADVCQSPAAAAYAQELGNASG